ncbi:major histocompatibility complex class I-related gene protein-like isoform X3 [Candoia aspera]|uniref:major histocompatibility complex class I-related gene protein-like isoform X3 n=1 Tax=Candoia aspera TaxID=51853 RepID=UPI002FD7CD2F
MRPRRWLLGLLGAAAFCLLEGSGSSSHLIRVSYISVSKAGPGLPNFSAVGYVDDQLIARYESHSKKVHPRVSWMSMLEEKEPQFCNRYTRILQKDEKDFQENVQMLQKRYNQSGEFHMVQMMISCEVWEDGSRSGRWQYGYDGRDFLSFDMNTASWTAADKEAQVIMRMWDTETAIHQRFKSYLESTCTELLEKDHRYGSGRFLRKEPPVVTVSSKSEADDVETLTCQVYGFYPKELDATWRRDGEILEHETLRGPLAPNSDKTYYTLLSIQVDPQKKYQYRCHVEHDALPKALSVALKAPESNLGLIIIIGCVVAALLLVSVIALILVFLNSNRDVPRSDPPPQFDVPQLTVPPC